jgi:Ni/Fe-hydrogenase subunit HybB-like protein/Fe-S-cluster-containing dehydrogenase component
MATNRRQFIKTIGGLAAAGAATHADDCLASVHGPDTDNVDGVLVDLSLCVGCRHCEYACKKNHDIDPGNLEDYDDTSVFTDKRRPAPDALTVINRWSQPEGEPVHAKVNCMHCNHASCVSACIVGALEKQPDGSVTYDTWKCIGCRYCMVACPFQIPTYEYNDTLTPRVRKCDFCADRRGEGELPACVEACPREAMVYGKRAELLELAHERITEHPDRYVDHVYGEHEVGGTSWMYISSVPFDRAGFLKLGNAAPPVLTEAIQHGVFKYWIAPVALYSFLSASMFFTRTKKVAAKESSPPADPPTMIGEGATVAVATADDYEGLPQPLPEHYDHHVAAQPVDRKLLTPGVWALIAMVGIGVAAGLYRFVFGLEATTNLDQQHPWGLWIAMDVGSGIALAGGGFVTAALVHIFHREHYHAIARSALLTALLGYTFYVPGLLADLGRYYNIWHSLLPEMWQVNSVLFEVGICVMIYLNVQYLELCPIICERFISSDSGRAKVRRIAKFIHDKVEFIMPALLILGVTLSFFHQSSLGNLMVIAPYKLHPLWWTPVSPVLFLLSAMMVGFPMVIFTILTASKSLKRQPEMDVLTPLSRYVPIFLSLYLAVKLGDVAYRGVWTHLLDPSLISASWMVEVVIGVVLPLAMLLHRGVRQSPRGLAVACLLVIFGVVLNRLNIFVIGYKPPFAETSYFPSMTEFALSMGLIAALMLAYRVAVTYLPILEPRPAAEAKR